MLAPNSPRSEPGPRLTRAQVWAGIAIPPDCSLKAMVGSYVQQPPDYTQPGTRTLASYILPKELVIQRDDLAKYRNKRHPEVLEIVWRAGPLDRAVLSSFPNVQHLDCSHQGLDDVDAISCCKSLQYFRCRSNHIVGLGVLETCTKLIEVDCESNHLVSLIGFDSLPNLRKLVCNGNHLSSLEELSSCLQLEHLNCSRNRITSLAGLKNCSLLSYLMCGYNSLRDLDGLIDCKSLTYLDCNSDCLTSLEPLLHLANLETLICYHNKITSLAGLENKSKLSKVLADQNKITSLKGLAGCTVLKELELSHNKLATISDLDTPVLETIQVSENYLSVFDLGSSPMLKLIVCDGNIIRTLDTVALYPTLTYLRCRDNCIESLAPLSLCIDLQTLDCSDNAITSLNGLANMRSLANLTCDTNYLETLEGIEGCRSLRALSCRSNRITTLEHVVHLRALRQFEYGGNPTMRSNPQVEHFLLILDQRSRGIDHIYADGENVMNTAVMCSTMTSIQNILKDPAPHFTLELLNGSGLSADTIAKLRSDCDDNSVSGQFLITYKQLLGYVWARICRSEHRVELIKILEQQVSDGQNRCLIGRITRLLTVLMGFFDDVCIAISPSAQIRAVVWATERAVRPYNPVTHRELVRVRLQELGYTEAESQPWLDAIHDLEVVA